MSVLLIRSGAECKKIEFCGEKKLSALLGDAGFALSSCGGKGKGGKCRVLCKIEGKNTEMRYVLACQTVLSSNAEVTLLSEKKLTQIKTEGSSVGFNLSPLDGKIGAAVDIGTSTIVMRVYDLETGEAIGTSAMQNPQRAVSDDVIGRIEASMNGEAKKLSKQILRAIDMLYAEIRQNSAQMLQHPDAMVITGNTVMLYLLTERCTEPLSHAPFAADTLFDIFTSSLTAAQSCYLPPCMNAFVGADITCAVLASGMTELSETSLLCDIGTNGEIALWKDNILYVTSTAAGPAFEGAGISCGCGGVSGAIDSVYTKNGELHFHTIDNAEPIGICGSGLISAVSEFLKLFVIDENGAAESELPDFTPSVFLTQADIRSLQLAKAAISAGIATLCEHAGVKCDEISRFYIAGGFGSYLDIDSAVTIGLFPRELAECAAVIGNAALEGAALMLLDRRMIERAREIAAKSQHINLAGNQNFYNNYINMMPFPKK